MKEIEQLLGLWQNRRRSNGDVRRIAQRHITDLDQKIQELESMRRTLKDLYRDAMAIIGRSARSSMTSPVKRDGSGRTQQ